MLKYKYIPPHKLRSQSSTPEPTPRINNKITHTIHSNNSSSNNHHNSTPLNSTYSPISLQNTHEYYGSANSLSVQGTPQNMSRNSDMRGSCLSLTSSAGGTVRSRKKNRAPLPPPQAGTAAVKPKELFPSSETVNSSKSGSPSSSTLSSPKSGRKKRPAPPPPKPARLENSVTPPIPENLVTASKNSLSYPLQSESESKMCDEEKALLEGNSGSKRRLIPLDASLLLDEEEFVSISQSQSDDLKQQQLNAEYEDNAVVYRRVIQPLPTLTPTHEDKTLLGDRQLEKLKDNKEAQNRNRQSQLASGEDLDSLMSNLMLGYSNKSTQ